MKAKCLKIVSNLFGVVIFLVPVLCVIFMASIFLFKIGFEVDISSEMASDILVAYPELKEKIGNNEFEILAVTYPPFRREIKDIGMVTCKVSCEGTVQEVVSEENLYTYQIKLADGNTKSYTEQIKDATEPLKEGERCAVEITKVFDCSLQKIFFESVEKAERL